jgi:TolB protein
MFTKKTIWVILLLSLTACQEFGVSHTPVSTMQNETASPVATQTALPTRTITPLPPSPTISPATQTPTPAPVERLAFTVSTDHGPMYPDTIIAFANSDGTDFETPNLFEPFRNTAGVTGKHLVWSPNGRFLAFDGADKAFGCGIPGTDCLETNYGTFLADYSQEKIVQYVESTLTNSSWSPDSQKLVLPIDEKMSSGGKNYFGDLYILDVKSGQKTQLTNDPSSDLYPAWSPDGQWIAFIRYSPNLKNYCGPFPRTDSPRDCDNASLYLIKPNGSNLRLLSEPIHVEAPVNWRHTPYNAPSWSPDSQWLAIMVENEGEPYILNQEIALVNVETGELRRLTHNNAMDVMPVWSPDGKHLAFVSNRDGNEEIYVMNSDGTNPTNLTKNPTCDYAPAWSPSGNYIAFMSCRGIYTMNKDGANLTRINGDYFSAITKPSWLPTLKP